MGIGASLTWYFRTDIFLWLLAPAGGKLSETGQPIFTDPTEMFSLTVGLIVKGGIVAAFPALVYNVYRLFSPLLTKQKRRLVILFIVMGFFFYIAGTAFTYFVLLPTGLKFLLNFGTDIAVPMIRVTAYMEMALAMLFWIGVVFELPVAMLLLAKLQVVPYERFKKLRRYVPAAAFIMGAIITPTFDMVNQALVAMPLIGLFEVGMFMVFLVRPRSGARK